MSSYSVYLQQARSDEEAARLIAHQSPEWAIVMCFYAALHYVDAYAAYQNIYINTKYSEELTAHKRRSRYIDDISDEIDATDLSTSYSQLLEASEISRYLKGISTTANEHFRKYPIDPFELLQVVKNKLEIPSAKALERPAKRK